MPGQPRAIMASIRWEYLTCGVSIHRVASPSMLVAAATRECLRVTRHPAGHADSGSSATIQSLGSATRSECDTRSCRIWPVGCGGLDGR